MGKTPNKLRTYNRTTHRSKSAQKLAIKRMMKQELLNKVIANRKYILFYITLGGDAGWRFTNKDEWCSMKYPLLFDTQLWTMETIKKELDWLDRIIFTDRHHGFTLAEKGDCGARHIQTFLDRVNGVYTINNHSPWGCCSKETIDMPSADKITNWSLNGENVNWENQFK